MTKQLDWRADISGCESLYDVDIYEMLIFLRHQYLESARDLILRNNKDRGDVETGHRYCEVAEALQQAFEAEFGPVINLR